MTEIKLLPLTGSFAENKDTARNMRLSKIAPALDKGDDVTLDFEGVDSATQSFVHALLSDIIRRYGGDVLDRIYFKNCSEVVKKIIHIVAAYTQEAEGV